MKDLAIEHIPGYILCPLSKRSPGNASTIVMLLLCSISLAFYLEILDIWLRTEMEVSRNLKKIAMEAGLEKLNPSLENRPLWGHFES